MAGPFRTTEGMYQMCCIFSCQSATENFIFRSLTLKGKNLHFDNPTVTNIFQIHKISALLTKRDEIIRIIPSLSTNTYSLVLLKNYLSVYAKLQQNKKDITVKNLNCYIFCLYEPKFNYFFCFCLSFQ